MAFFSVDPEKCNQDRHCVAECPGHLIQWDEKSNLPAAIEQAEEMCIQCGHCVAVCPTKALSLSTMAADACEPVQKELLPTAEQTAHLLKARRSIRSYRKAPVPKETLAELIDIARFAPSGHNLQPVYWQVESDPERIRNLCGLVIDWMRYMIAEKPEIALHMGMDRVTAAWDKGKDRILRDAPHVIIAHGAKADPTFPTAATIALTHLELAAFSHGLGVCWAGYFNTAANVWPPMRAALGLAEENIAGGALMIGYPRFAYHRIPQRRPMAVTFR